MTPRERAIESLNLLRQNAWKRNATYSQCFLDDMADIIEQAILADRQTLQSEIVDKLRALRYRYSNDAEYTQAFKFFSLAITETQSVFAQQSQPEERPKIQGFQVKPERGAGIETIEPGRTFTITDWLTEAESDRRVLAEREACAKAAISWTSDYREVDICHKAAAAIRARSNQPEGKFVPYNHYQCWLCSAAPDRHSKHIDSPDRIATLHEWQARDALTIQQLNESNNLLSEKIAQLEKEKNELTQKVKELDDYMQFLSESEFSIKHPGPTNRKA